MESFKVLIFDDDPIQVRIVKQNMELDASNLAGPNQELLIDTASNQVEARAMVLGLGSKEYDLIILDLEYPVDSDPNTLAFRGDKWLPELRLAQPNAAIAIMTAYGHERHLAMAVKTLRDGGADEFIPKDAAWVDTLLRLQAALIHRQKARQLAAVARPILSNVERTTSEDLLLAINRAEGKLERIKSENGALLSAPQVSATFGDLRADIEEITSRLHGHFDIAAAPIKCCKFVQDQALFFDPQLKSPIKADCLGDCTVMTYAEDLKVALREVLQNAVDAVAVKSGSDTPLVSILAERKSELNSVIIAVRDGGPGFTPEAMASLFEPGSSFWPKDKDRRHKGMGLYVARRMMYAIGGDVEVRTAEGGGTEVRLVVRDWGPK